MKFAIFRAHAAARQEQMSVWFSTFNDVRESENESLAELAEKQRKKYIEVNANYNLEDEETFVAANLLAPQVKQFITKHDV